MRVEEYPLQCKNSSDSPWSSQHTHPFFYSERSNLVFYAQTCWSYIWPVFRNNAVCYNVFYKIKKSRHIPVACSHIHMALLCLFWESKTFRTIACLSKLWIQSLSSFQFCFSCCRFIHLVNFFVIFVCCLTISASCCCVFVCVFLSPVRALSGIIHACGI